MDIVRDFHTLEKDSSDSEEESGYRLTPAGLDNLQSGTYDPFVGGRTSIDSPAAMMAVIMAAVGKLIIRHENMFSIYQRKAKSYRSLMKPKE